MKLYGIHYRKIEMLQKYWPLERWIAVINPFRFEWQTQHHQHLQHAVLSTHKHMAAAVTAEESHHAEGRSKVKRKFLIKDVSWKEIVFAGTLENNSEKKSSKPDGDERLLQESPFPTRHHYFSQQLWSKIYPIYKDTFISGYRLQFTLTSVTPHNTLSGFDMVPALPGLVILSRDGKQALLLFRCTLVAGCKAHKHTLEWHEGQKVQDTTGDWQKNLTWAGAWPLTC